MARKFQIKRGLKANLPALAQGEFAMTTDSGTECLWLGTGSRNKKIPLDPTAADVGAVSKAGDTMTNALNITNGTNTLTLNRADFGVIIEGFLEGEYNTFRRYLGISNRSTRPDGNEALRYNIVENGTGASRVVHHEGNKPKGSYTGNGSGASRTIQTGGIGNMLIIWSTTGKSFVTPGGGLYSIGTTITNFAVNVAKFENGVLTLTTTDQTMNTNGQTYHYQVL